ncbi:MAG: shikimate kinase [Firmicutes bacterium]|nr:shikimate kinase [Bacillota bacterium]MDD4264128.1 shikimate kinase [Bacillota bacterium]MDD4694160.1 shikimate kinase [Bacillota bacterium]
MIVYLIGFMAAGKSTIGPLLAKKLGLPFMDLDFIIENQAKKSIPEIFLAEGEAGFRKRESVALFNKPDKGVVATGGGIITEVCNREFLKSQLVVFLKTDFFTVKQRIAKHPETRPLADNDLEKRFNQRQPLYLEVANFVVDTAGKTAQEIVEEVYSWMLR